MCGTSPVGAGLLITPVVVSLHSFFISLYSFLLTMRFQRRKSFLGDLVRLNLSGGGVSLSVGVPGARMHIPLVGKRSPGYTVGIPGSGVSHSGKLPE